jgi:hypothetical protein
MVVSEWWVSDREKVSVQRLLKMNGRKDQWRLTRLLYINTIRSRQKLGIGV